MVGALVARKKLRALEEWTVIAHFLRREAVGSRWIIAETAGIHGSLQQTSAAALTPTAVLRRDAGGARGALVALLLNFGGTKNLVFNPLLLEAAIGVVEAAAAIGRSRHAAPNAFVEGSAVATGRCI